MGMSLPAPPEWKTINLRQMGKWNDIQSASSDLDAVFGRMVCSMTGSFPSGRSTEGECKTQHTNTGHLEQSCLYGGSSVDMSVVVKVCTLLV